MVDRVLPESGQADLDRWVADMQVWMAEGGTYRVKSDHAAASCLVLVGLFFPLLFGFFAVIAGDPVFGTITGVLLLGFGAGYAFIRLSAKNTCLYVNADEVGRTNWTGYPVVWFKRRTAAGPAGGASRDQVLGASAHGWNLVQYQLLNTLVTSPPSDAGHVGAPDARKVEEVTHEIERLFHFGPRDLRLNRRGKLSAGQLFRLGWRQTGLLLTTALVVAFTALVVFALVHGVDWWAYGRALAVLLSAPILVIYLMWRSWAVVADMATRKALSCRGKLFMKPMSTWWDHRPGFVLYNCPGHGQFKFTAPPSSPDRLPEEISGVIYFTPRSSFLLGVEVESVSGFRRPVHQ